MSNLAAEMPKKEETKSVQGHLMPDKYEEFKSIADKLQWSAKRLNENILLWFIEEVKKKPKLLKEIRDRELDT